MGTAYGFDTASYIYNADVAAPATAKFGTGSFYIRYLNPSPYASVMTSSTGNSEADAAWDNGAHYLTFVSEPDQSRLNGTSAMGTSDASAFCAALLSVYQGIAPLFINSSTSRVDVFLGIESSTNLSSAYWAGWASYIDGYAMPGFSAPLYPGIYCNPGSGAANCSSAVGYWCYSVWANEPEPCAACGTFGSVGWQAESCYNSPGSVGPTVVWQMAEQNGCMYACNRGSYPNVDVDMTNPGYTELDYMFYLSYRP